MVNGHLPTPPYKTVKVFVDVFLLSVMFVYVSSYYTMGHVIRMEENRASGDFPNYCPFPDYLEEFF